MKIQEKNNNKNDTNFYGKLFLIGKFEAQQNLCKFLKRNLLEIQHFRQIYNKQKNE